MKSTQLEHRSMSKKSSSSSVNLWIRPYQTAVALSNIGVTLIERQLYADAVITIRDALFIIRAFADPTRECNATQTNELPTQDDMQYMIERATNCLFHNAVESDRSSYIKLTTLSDLQTSILDIFQVVNEANHFLVRIDFVDDMDDYATSYAMHYKTSAILLNYGTACQCLHHALGRTREFFNNIHNVVGNFEFLQESRRFLVISHGIVTRQMDSIIDLVYDSQYTRMEVEVTRTLCLNLLVVQSLINICSIVGENNEIDSYRCNFDIISQTIARMCHTQCWNYSATAASA